jgi:hypothetical protein
MTTISAGAAAGLLVALMVVATGESRGAELVGQSKSAQDSQVRADLLVKTLSRHAA